MALTVVPGGPFLGGRGMALVPQGCRHAHAAGAGEGPQMATGCRRPADFAKTGGSLVPEL
jgi:hypothetical protein